MKTTGAFAIAVSLISRSSLHAQTEAAGGNLTNIKGGDATPSLWIAIEDDGTVKITCHRSEMGQQVWTSMAQIVADELEAAWDDVEIVQALGDPKYGDQNTDGSRSVRYNFHRLRVAGAAMRLMLETAAAAQWGVEVADCVAKQSKVHHQGSNRTLSFGELAAEAGALELPTEEDVSLKQRADWRYIGKPVPSRTVPLVVRGKGTYGIDMERPGMVYAVVARPPQVHGKVGSVDDSAALQVAGVTQTLQIPPPPDPVVFNPLGGVAVVASDTWSAIQGRNALKVQWEDGPNASYDTTAFRKQLEEAVRQPGNPGRSRGDAVAAIAAADRTHTAEYFVPQIPHATLEPVSATAEWKDGMLECWGCVQDPQNTRNVLAGFFGIDTANIKVHATWLGGAFGRKSKPDFVVEAAFIAKEVGKPVKVTWTREDDLRHGYYHSISAQRVEAAMDSSGKCTALLHRTAFPSIASTFAAGVDEPVNFELGLGASDNPYNMPHLQVEACKAPAHVRVGWLRSVSNIQHAFAIQSFTDELAHAAGRDPVEHLLEMIGPARHVKPAEEGADYPNYDASIEEYPIDTGRLSHVVKHVAKMADWGRKLPKGRGLGIAAHRSFLSYIATIVEVEVGEDGSLAIPGIWLAVDAGTVVNPRHTRAQMEGGTIFGLSNALYGNLTAKNGAIVEANFPDWRLMRMPESPRAFEVEIVESNEIPAGVGEPATPPAAPALTNAIFAATGKRMRELPLIGPINSNLPLNQA